jgi:hypothetical protein
MSCWRPRWEREFAMAFCIGTVAETAQIKANMEKADQANKLADDLSAKERLASGK